LTIASWGQIAAGLALFTAGAILAVERNKSK
jgi:hypothetical protein